MADENIKGLIIGVVVKILVVVGIGTAIAFWSMSKI
jgi:tetrahydromethanopterin S-methyltransferase subunit F